MFQLNKNFIFSFLAAIITVVNFNMLILILINVQCLQNVVFSFEKDSNSQNNFSLDSHHPIKNFLRSKIFNCPHLEEFPPTFECYLVKT